MYYYMTITKIDGKVFRQWIMREEPARTVGIYPLAGTQGRDLWGFIPCSKAAYEAAQKAESDMFRRISFGGARCRLTSCGVWGLLPNRHNRRRVAVRLFK